MDLRRSHRLLPEPEQQPQRPDLIGSQEPRDSAELFNIDYAELVRCPLLGSGRYGRVHRYEFNGKTVAVKDIAFTAEERVRLERFLREGKIHMELRNRNIITLFAKQLLPQNLLLVMEFAAGGSLSAVIKRHVRLIESSVVTDWAAQIAEGMRYLHEKDIVHRDLNSRNILVLEPIENSSLFGKTIKIADFGLACEGHDETRTMSEARGTPYWMAPEVVEEPHRFSKASDVYSFGMVVLNLLTGKEPSKDIATNGIQIEKDLPTSQFYDELLNNCCTTERSKRPTFVNITLAILQWQEQHSEKSAPISLCNEELGSVSVNFLAAPTKPLSFNISARGPFKGPGKCWDVAVTPHGSLLVAATADGLKEYDAASFREMATWKPDRDLLGQEKTVWVRAVDVLSNGRAVVGLNPKVVVLLQRSVVSGRSAAAAWRVERRLAELQAPPRHLSAWDDRLLAVLEDRWDESSGWWPGPGLLLLSLSDDDGGGGTQLHNRLQLQYNAGSVALNERFVMVASSGQFELGDGSGGGGNVVDCYSHLGVRLWRHELAAWDLCTDSVGRVLYAATYDSVLALSVDDGRVLSTAVTLTTKETKIPYAISLGREIQHLLALLSFDDNSNPNIITIFKESYVHRGIMSTQLNTRTAGAHIKAPA